MSRDIISCLLAVVVWCGLSTMSDCASIAVSGSRSLADMQSSIDAYVDAVMSYKQMPGLSLAVVNGDTDQLVKGYGVKRLGTDDMVTADTLFYIASTTKAMTASVLLQTMTNNKYYYSFINNKTVC